MKSKVKEILSLAGLPDTAVCEFEFVKNRLLPCRAAARLPKTPKSIIMVAFPYKVRESAPENISRYAAVKDYHIVCKQLLDSAAEKLRAAYPSNTFEVFIDNSPIPEVAAAVHAGLGVLGKNGLLIHKKHGSYVFLGEIVTDLELTPDKGGEKCPQCGRCAAVCPTGLCKDTCLSSVTQRKGELSDCEIAKIKMSGCVWGCDICQENCRENKNAQITYIDEFIESYRNAYVSGEDTKGRAYMWRTVKVIERNNDIIKNTER